MTSDYHFKYRKLLNPQPDGTKWAVKIAFFGRNRIGFLDCEWFGTTKEEAAEKARHDHQELNIAA